MSTSVIRFSCNNCHQTIKAASKHIGRKSRCPSCKKEVVVPQDNQVRAFSDEIPLAAMSLGDDVNIEDFDSDVPSSVSRRDANLGSPVDSRVTAYRDEPEIVDQASASERRNYPALNRTSVGFRVLAGMAMVVWVFQLASTLLGLETSGASGPNKEATETLSILSFTFAYRFIGGAACICGFLGASELIRLAIDIQDNTHLAARRAGRTVRG